MHVLHNFVNKSANDDLKIVLRRVEEMPQTFDFLTKTRNESLYAGNELREENRRFGIGFLKVVIYKRYVLTDEEMRQKGGLAVSCTRTQEGDLLIQIACDHV